MTREREMRGFLTGRALGLLAPVPPEPGLKALGATDDCGIFEGLLSEPRESGFVNMVRGRGLLVTCSSATRRGVPAWCFVGDGRGP